MADITLEINGTTYKISGVAQEEQVLQAISGVLSAVVLLSHALKQQGILDAAPLIETLTGVIAGDGHPTWKAMLAVYKSALEGGNAPPPSGPQLQVILGGKSLEENSAN